MTAAMGIDPGVRGGVAVLAPGGAVLFARPIKPNMTQKEAVAVVAAGALILLKYGGWECWVEKVGYRPTDGGKGANTFGRIDGLLRGAALALGLELHDAPPMLWQAKLGCMSGGNKNVTKHKAIQMFGGTALRITHAIADALLIAEFGRQTLISRR